MSPESGAWALAAGRNLMSTAAVSSTSIFQELQSFYQNRQSDLKQLGDALQSGNLNGAQQAYTTLAQLGQDGPFANSEPFSKSSRAQAFNAVGEALQAGDLARAQTAFATLTVSQSTTGTSATPATVVNLTGTQPAAGTPASASSVYEQIQAYRQQKQADVAQLGQDLAAGNTNAAEQDFTALTALGQSGPNANGQVFQNSTRAQDFQAIGQALQSGDLAGAQSDFANLASTYSTFQGSPAVGPASVVPSTVSPVVQPDTPIAQPLVAPASTSSGVNEIIINLESPSSTNSSTTSTPPEIVINFGQSSGSSSPLEDITINLGGASSTNASSLSGSTTTGATTGTTSTTPEIVINLGQSNGSSSATPEEITINFGTSSSGAQITIDNNLGQNGSAGQQQTINLNPQNNYELVLNLLSPSSTGQTPSASGNALSVQA
jgi:hypothetical protein